MRLVLGFLLALAVPVLASEGVQSEATGLFFSIPEGWERVQTSSPLRAAQFRIPRARHDADDGEVILFQFNDPKGGRTLDAIERWYAQITPADGRPSKEAAVVTTRSVNGLTVKTVDLSGTYRPQMGPMEHRSRPGYRLLGAVVEGEGGPWYWRAVGPAKTMENAKEGFDALVGSFRVRR